jgi:hypothetical protein
MLAIEPENLKIATKKTSKYNPHRVTTETQNFIECEAKNYDLTT